jgi:hypothetical protein
VEGQRSGGFEHFLHSCHQSGDGSRQRDQRFGPGGIHSEFLAETILLVNLVEHGGQALRTRFDGSGMVVRGRSSESECMEEADLCLQHN